ncbi:MAG TPA: lysine--tRNA ligase, partial [Burkholderiaceae bacterium]|nr:lysine--tRNA ligase [Burkholderiaceae bacterium]
MSDSPAHHDTAAELVHRDDNAIVAERRAKLARLRENGTAYPNDFRPSHRAAAIAEHFGFKTREQLEAERVEVTLAGRIMLKRVQGKASFATIQDATGRVQLYLNDEGVGADAHAAFKHWDLGDIVGCEGVLFKTMKGELSVRCTGVRLLAKSLRPLPDKFHGIADPELRYRQRYVDLIVTGETRDTFIARSRTIGAIRAFMGSHGFLEVETPMLHPIPGGAAARPFVTHHNALDQQMFLRVAPELYLKRLVVGGFERVYEINRNFRNEGISPRHNPEFTMLEFYAAYTDYRWLMDFTEQVIRDAALAATGSSTVTYQGRTIDLGRPFERLSITGAIARYAPRYAPAQLQDAGFLRGELTRLGVAVDGPQLGGAAIGALQLALFEEVAEHQLWDPTYIVDYPVE